MEKLYYLSHYLYRKKVPVLPKVVELMIRFFFHASIPYQVQIGPGVTFGHRQGIMMGKRVKIGARCKIRHQVTIAGGAGGGASACGAASGAVELVRRILAGDRGFSVEAHDPGGAWARVEVS